MSYDFFNRKTVIGRKDHRCEHCNGQIVKGESHFYCAGKFEGNLVDYREHVDCQKAWIALNEKLRDNKWEDSHPFLADDDYDVGEREWLHQNFPVVAVRLWPKQFGRAA